jgi:hypothetical protein
MVGHDLARDGDDAAGCDIVDDGEEENLGEGCSFRVPAGKEVLEE